MKTKSALSYFGSDSEVAAELAALLNHCKHVTIPFCGGLAILPHLTARGIVANDLNADAINFYRVLQHPTTSRELMFRCSETLSHPGEIARAVDVLACQPFHAPEVRAWAYWAVCWIGRKGKGGTKHVGGMPSVRRKATGGNNASRLQAAAGDLKAWAEHFKRCEFESVDFRELLPKVADDPSCGIYCDPPWYVAGRNYRHAFNKNDHYALADLFDRFEKTTVVLRYGDEPEIRQIYDLEEWETIEAKSRTQAGSKTGEIWFVKNGATNDV